MMHRLTIVGVATIMASAATAQVNLGPLGLTDLLTAAVRYEKPRADKFTPRPADTDIIGRSFKVAVRFPEMVDEGGPQAGRLGGWVYDAERGTLRLTPWVEMIVGDELTSDPALKGVDRRFRGFAVKANGRYVGRVVEGNAMGATIDVDEYTATTIAIAAFHEGWGTKKFPDPAPDDHGQTISVSPADARSLTAHLSFVTEGEIAAYTPGHAIACGDTITPATLQRHSERVIHECVVSARIDRYAIEDDRSGKVLAEWRAPAV